MPLGEISGATRGAARTESHGVYGLRLRGLPHAPSNRLAVLDERYPLVQVERAAERTSGAAHFDEASARFDLYEGQGHVDVRRDPLSVRFDLSDAITDDAILHPFFALPAATVNWWLGRLSFHAGAFLTATGEAIAILGDKGAGKTTTLAALHECGSTIMADDMLVLDRDQVLAGPACIDLRRDTACWFSGSKPMGVVGARERWRLDVDQPPPRATLGGFVVPTWGERLELVPVPVERRLKLLLTSQSLLLPPRHPEAVLDLLGLPFFELRRPPGRSPLDAAVSMLRSL